MKQKSIAATNSRNFSRIHSWVQESNGTTNIYIMRETTVYQYLYVPKGLGENNFLTFLLKYGIH